MIVGTEANPPPAAAGTSLMKGGRSFQGPLMKGAVSEADWGFAPVPRKTYRVVLPRSNSAFSLLLSLMV